ncbi:hypothetical protein [Methylovulum psychrotolerans]|nr:hypothetical protein [Methylovulum psychrotolerans]
MTINELSEFVWQNSLSIDFGAKPTWNVNLFLQEEWAKSQSFSDKWLEASSGWYWFLIEMSYDELHKIKKPPTLPEKGCDIGLLTHEHLGIFGNSLLCSPLTDNMLVIYNGHEKNVTSRIRSHFALNNQKTGAIGIKHYPLSLRRWQVRFFSLPCIPPDTEKNIQDALGLLINSKPGRCAIETAWRSNNGWPILCKE